MDNNPRTAPRDQHGWLIGHVAGVPIHVARSWLVIGLVAIAIFFPTASRLLPGRTEAAVIASLGFVVILLISVLAHEIGHTLVARARGHRVHRVVISGWGGHTSFSSAQPDPVSMLLIALVGPVVNLLLAVILHVSQGAVAQAGGNVTALLLDAGTVVNGLMAVFNLLPILPLDGARALEAIAWWIGRDQDRATIMTAWLGRILVVAALGAGLVLAVAEPEANRLRLPLVVVFAWIGWRSCSAALSQARLNRSIDALTLEQVLVPAASLDQACSVDIVRHTMSATATDVVVLVDHAHRPLAYVEAHQVQQVPHHLLASTPARAVAVTLAQAQALSVDLRGNELLEQIRHRAHITPVLVVAGPSGIVGIVRVRDVVAVLRST